ncbi:MAG TPA: glycosyltransferase, partial [Candidatus Cloacimonadota bacterium]|nr:glycosyltransferase [Candidatus Cloacimonadota bacterium]
MKFLVITNYYPPYFQGGYEICCEEMCRYLHTKGHEVFILTGTYGVEAPDDTYWGIPEYKPLRILKYIDYEGRDYLQKTRVENFNYSMVKQAIKEVKPDLVYFWSLKSLSLAPVYAAKKLKCKWFFDIGDIWLGAYFQPGMSAKFKRSFKSVFPFTIGGKLDFNPVMLSTRWMIKDMKELYKTNKIYIVPRGIDLPAPSVKVKNSVVRYMFTGRIEPLKGLDLCLRAFAVLRDLRPDFEFKFDIYGTEEQPYGEFCHTLVDRF